MRRVLIIWVLLAVATAAGGQVGIPDPEQVEQLIDETADAEELTADDLERILELRAYYAERPLDLNDGETPTALVELKLITVAQGELIGQRRREAGDFASALELQAVPGLTLGEVRALLPYVTVRETLATAARTLRDRARDLRAFAAVRTGFQTTTADVDRWAGPRLPVYARFRATAGRKFSVGVVVDQDAGEPYRVPGRTLPVDYVGVHAYADELPGALETVALGDFGVNWGQGLVSYSGFGSGKGSAVIDVQRHARWLIPHASAAEAGFYRGAAVTTRRGRWRLAGLASRRALDGAVDTTLASDDASATFGTVRLGGYHRTTTELRGRGSNAATSYGGALAYAAPWGRLSVHALRHRFAVPFRPGERLYQAGDFGGHRMTNASVAWQTFLGPVSWYGEAAVDGGGATAVLSGVQSALDRRTDVSLVYRRYDVDYRTLYENVFGTTRRPSNEEGLYLGVRSALSERWLARGFVDVYRHPYARFRLSRPSLQADYLARLTYAERRRYEVYLQLRIRDAERELSRDASGPTRAIVPYRRRSLRLQAEVTLSRDLRLRTRLELARSRTGAAVSEGTLLYQDVLWSPLGGSWSVTGRLALVDTDDFESRIYAYENDLLYRFRIPAYYGRGYRGYVNVRHRVSKAWTAEVRAAYGRRREARDQGEVAVQVRWGGSLGRGG